MPRTVGFSERLEGSLRELEDLFENPNTLLTIRDLQSTLKVTRPALEFIAPYQTVCSYWNYFIHFLGEHWSQTSALGGTVQNQGVKLANLFQPNTIANTEASRNWDTPPGVDPVGAKAGGEALGRLYTPFYRPAIDAQKRCSSSSRRCPSISSVTIVDKRSPAGSALLRSTSG